jgi:hypothetical protein
MHLPHSPATKLGTLQAAFDGLNNAAHTCGGLQVLSMSTVVCVLARSRTEAVTACPDVEMLLTDWPTAKCLSSALLLACTERTHLPDAQQD